MFNELVKDAYNSAMGYLEKACVTQNTQERHLTFSNLVLKRKLRKSVRFVCEREKGGFLQPDKLAEDCIGTINKTVASVLDGKCPSKTITSCTTLETYEKTPIFIPINITEESVEYVARKRLGSSGLGGTGSEALQGWLLKFGDDSTRLRTIFGNLVDWLANGSSLWATYCAFMTSRLIALDKQPGVRPVDVGETWRFIFANILLKVTGPE